MDLNTFQKTLMEHFEGYYAAQKSDHPNGEQIDDDEWLATCGINAAMFSMSTGMDALKLLYQQVRPATVQDQAQLIQGMIDVFLGCTVMISTVGIDMDEFCRGVLEIVAAQMGDAGASSGEETSPENGDEEWPEYVSLGEGNVH